MTLSRTLAAMIAASLCLKQSVSHAQAAGGDSLPLRTGQWALETGLIGTTLSLLRFNSPRSALMLRASASLSAFNDKYDDGSERTSSFSSIGLQAGRRSYAPFAGNAATVYSLGVSGSYSLRNDDYRRENAGTLGLFGEIGGAYFPNRRMSVQVLLSSTAAYRHAKTDVHNSSFYDSYTTRSISIFPVDGEVTATFYFR
jgi:hypothetical protein